MSTIKISDLSKDSKSFMNDLAGGELGDIQGGWIPAAALGLGLYVAFTNENERLLHRDAFIAGGNPNSKTIGRLAKRLAAN